MTPEAAAGSPSFDRTELPGRLRDAVTTLAGEIGERHTALPQALTRAASWIQSELTAAGYEVAQQPYVVEGVPCANVEAELRGGDRADELLIIGAHYDSAPGTPGANDNGTGVAAVLALARAFAGLKPRRTIRWLAFVNEEPPHFLTERMGSWQYAHRCKQRGERVAGMVSLETLGYYDDAPGSQKYPWPLDKLYPDTGNFIGIVSNLRSAGLGKRLATAFRAASDFPCERAALPGFVPGVDWSDQWGFWQHGMPALMVTDTAPYRYPHYHEPSDTPDKVDYVRLSRVVEGLAAAFWSLAS